MSGGESDAGVAVGSQFPTTRWSLIVATRQRPTTQARDALAHLCASYWYPLYVFVRRRCERIEDAQDLTQGLFACLLMPCRFLALIAANSAYNASIPPRRRLALNLELAKIQHQSHLLPAPLDQTLPRIGFQCCTL
jgi:hypothetical protein